MSSLDWVILLLPLSLVFFMHTGPGVISTEWPIIWLPVGFVGVM